MGVALAASVAGAVKFEAQMRNVASIDRQVEQNFAATSQAVLNMSKHLPQSASTLADGLYNIAGSGFYGADAMGILDVSARAASAGLTDTNTASKAIVASLNAYGLGAGSATRISDALFSTVNYGVLSFEALTAAVAHTVGNAAQAGIEIEEVGSALATMTLSGLSASNAGVSLNNMISKLIKPSKALSATYQQLGINIQEDLRNPSIGLSGVMQKLRQEGESNLKVWLKWFPEIRAARGAMALASAEGENYKRVIGQMGTEQKTAGETARVFAIQAQSAQHQIEILGNKIAVTGIELGMKMLPAVEKSVSALTSLGGSARNIATEVGGHLAPGFGAWADAARDVVDVLDDMQVDELIGLAAKIGVGALVAGFNGLGAAVSGTTGFLSDHTIAVEALVAAWLLFKSAAIITAIRSIAVAIQVGLVMGLMRAIDGTAALVARLTALMALGSVSLWRGLAAGALFFGGTLVAATAGVGLLVTELKRISDAKADIRNAKMSIEDILGQAPGGAANSIGQVADEIEKVGPKSQKSFTQARSELEKLRGEAQKSLDSLNKRNDQNFWDPGFWKFWELFKRTGAEARAAEQGVNLFDAALAKLDADEAQYTANLNALATQYGLTTDAVARLANEYDINLVGSLNEADASGKTSAQTFRTLATDLVGAGASTAQMNAAMAQLDTVIGGGAEAVKELNVQLDLFMGKGMSTAQAVDAVEKGFLDLAAGIGITKGGLLGYDQASLDNRATIYTQIEAIRTAAQAFADQSGSTDQARMMFDNYIAKLKQSLIDQGKTRAEVDALFDSFGNLISLDPVAVNVSTPGVNESRFDVEQLRGVLNSIPRSVTSTVTVARQEKWLAAAASPTGPSAQYLSSTLPVGNAGGGPIAGPGTGTSDSIPAMLSNGEWVIRAASASRYGPEVMAAINAGQARVLLPGYAAGGAARLGATRPAGSSGSASRNTGSAGSGTTGAIGRIASGASELAEVYQQTTAGVVSAGRALRDVVPRMWRADQSSTSLAGATGAVDGQMGAWLDTILRTTDGVDTHRDGLVGLARQVGGMTATELPGIIAATRTSTTATGAATTASRVFTAATDVARVAVATATQGTGVHTEASRVLTTATQVGTQTLRVATEATRTGTAATGLQTSAVRLGTVATTAGTAATRTQTSATGQQTAATRTQTTATGQGTTATNVARTATTAFSGVVRTASADLGTNAGAARNAAAAVRDYTAAVNSIPAARSTTVTTNYVTTGTKQPAGYAAGGRIYGPGTGTSDSVPIMASNREWIIRAAAADRYGPAAMSAINAGTARVLVGAATGAPGYAAGGPVGYAQGGMVRGSWAPVSGGGGGGSHTTTFVANVTVNGASDAKATATLVRREVDSAFGRLASKIDARPGRGRGRG